MFSFLTYRKAKSSSQPSSSSAGQTARSSRKGTSPGCTCSDNDNDACCRVGTRNPNSISDRHASRSVATAAGDTGHATSTITHSRKRLLLEKRELRKLNAKKAKPPSTNLLSKPLAVAEVSRQSVSFTSPSITPAMKGSSSDILISTSSQSSYRSANESRSSALAPSNDGQTRQQQLQNESEKCFSAATLNGDEYVPNPAVASQKTMTTAQRQQHIPDRGNSADLEETRLSAGNDSSSDSSDRPSRKEYPKPDASETQTSYSWFSWFTGRSSQPDEERHDKQPTEEPITREERETASAATVNSETTPDETPMNDACEGSPSPMKLKADDDELTHEPVASSDIKDNSRVQTSPASATWKSWISGFFYSQQQSQDDEATSTMTQTDSEDKPVTEHYASQSPLRPCTNQKDHEASEEEQPKDSREETTIIEDIAVREKESSQSKARNSSSESPYRWSFWSRFRSTAAVNDVRPDSSYSVTSEVPIPTTTTTENLRSTASMPDMASESECYINDQCPSSASSLRQVAKAQSTQVKGKKTSNSASKTKAVPPPPPNFVLPELHSTYKVHSQHPSLLDKIGHLGRYLVSASSTATTTDIPTPRAEERQHEHVFLTSRPPRIRKAVAIGVHGYFPAGIVQTFLGPPTGTSVRFATMAARAIIDWNKRHGQKSRIVEMATSPNETERCDRSEDEWDEVDLDEDAVCEISTIPLQGEGRISDRVETLYRLLLVHIETLKQADFIFVACHSQGVPVTTMLLARLLNEFPGILNRSTLPSPTRIGVCAMAGVSLGPFPDFQSRFPILGGTGSTLNQLFDFANPESVVSRDYRSALESVLRAGVRVTYVGSLDDQLVPLESSVFTTVSHPYIYRAVFIDGRVHAPSFLSHLMSFIMKLRNLGISDHGLIHELSPQVAGRLYRGDGHSRVYLEDAVYRTAVSFALESLPMEDSAVHNDPNALTLKTTSYNRSATPNPYCLPFIMRGVLAEDYVKRQMSEDVNKLIALFKEWEPMTAGLKDMKFRLEGIRSNL